MGLEASSCWTGSLYSSVSWSVSAALTRNYTGCNLVLIGDSDRAASLLLSLFETTQLAETSTGLGIIGFLARTHPIWGRTIIQSPETLPEYFMIRSSIHDWNQTIFDYEASGTICGVLLPPWSWRRQATPLLHQAHSALTSSEFVPGFPDRRPSSTCSSQSPPTLPRFVNLALTTYQTFPVREILARYRWFLMSGNTTLFP